MTVEGAGLARYHRRMVIAPRFVARLLLLPLTVVVAVACLLPNRAMAVDAATKQKAIAASIIAKESLQKGNFKEAADLYDRAFGHDPTEPGYLYSAARAKQKDGRLADAEKDYVEVLKFKALPAAMADKARQHLLEVRSARAAKLVADLEKKKKAMEAESAKPKPATPSETLAGKGDRKLAPEDRPSATTTKPAPAANHTVSYITLGGGGLALVAAGAIYGLASAQRSTLEAGFPKSHGGDGSLTWEQAEVEAQSIANKKTASAVLAGVGVVGLGAGVWMLLNPSDKADRAAGTLIAPTADGRGLTVRVQF